MSVGSRSSVTLNFVAFATPSSMRFSDGQVCFRVILCAPSSSAALSAQVGSHVLEAPAPIATVDDGADLDLLDTRVGKILKAWKHPEADALYVEEVDVGEPEEPRTICSGLVKYVPLEALEGQGRAVVVLANLKARNMQGVKSKGMLFCASNAAHQNVELLNPPEGAFHDERIWFGLEYKRAIQQSTAAPNQYAYENGRW